jgi:hypothetical protein
MHNKQQYRHIGAALLITLALVACDPVISTGPASTQATMVPPAPTQAPTSAPPATAMPAPTPVTTPTETAMPAPTILPTALISPTPVMEVLLPNDVPWVFRAGIIYGDDESLDFQQRGYSAPGWNLRAAPNGDYIAYISQQDQLVVIDMRNGTQITPEQRDIHVAGFAFAPDSRALAYRVVDGPLQILDLPSEQKRSISEPPTDRPLLLSPVAWSPAGLVVERLLWGSDALPQGLALIEPVSGTISPLREREHLRAVPSPNGRRIALVTGSVPIGGAPKAAITLLDIASGTETTIVPERQQVIKALHWSPGESRLLYAESVEYQSTITTLHVLNSDATPELVLELGGKEGGPTFTDAVWRNNSTVLLLSAEGGPRLQLYTLPLESFDIAGLQPIMGIRIDPDQRLDQIVYTPQVP